MWSSWRSKWSCWRSRAKGKTRNLWCLRRNLRFFLRTRMSQTLRQTPASSETPMIPRQKRIFCHYQKLKRGCQRRTCWFESSARRKRQCWWTFFREIEKLHLSIIYSSALSFGSSVLDTTIVAEVHYFSYCYY